MIRFVVIRVMDTKPIADLVLGHGAELASMAIALTNVILERFTKARSVAFAGDATLPSWVIFARQCFSDSEKPFFVLSIFLTTFARCLFHFVCPCSRYFAGNYGPLSSFQEWFRLTFQSLAQPLIVFRRALISRTLFQCRMCARRATLNSARNGRATVNTQVWLMGIYGFSHLISLV